LSSCANGVQFRKKCALFVYKVGILREQEWICLPLVTSWIEYLCIFKIFKSILLMKKDIYFIGLLFGCRSSFGQAFANSNIHQLIPWGPSKLSAMACCYEHTFYNKIKKLM